MTTIPHEPAPAGSKDLLSSDSCSEHAFDDGPHERPMGLNGFDADDRVRTVLEHVRIGHQRFMLECRIERRSRAILGFSIRPIDTVS